MKFFNLIFIITACVVLMPLGGCSNDADLNLTDISDASVFNSLKNTTWVCPLTSFIEEIYFSPSADGATYTRTSYLTGSVHANYGKVVSDNTVVNGLYYLSNAEGAIDNKYVVKQLSERTLLCNYEGKTMSSSGLEFCRVDHTITCRIGAELSANDLGLKGKAQCFFYPGMLFYIKEDKLVSTGEGLAYLMVHPEEGEEYAVKIIVQRPFYKKTDIVLFPYENLLLMTFERADHFFQPAPSIGDDGLRIYSRNKTYEPSFIDMVELYSIDDMSVVDCVRVRLNNEIKIADLITMLDSLNPSCDKEEREDCKRYALTNAFGVPYYLTVEYAEHALLYSAMDDPHSTDVFDKVAFEEDRFLN